ncbi:MAG: glycosyltransferase [Gomphosphaeria aponina SAG 52.96 = DSM 107014]|uniref:Glycosyltransferase n=1 Tax=Gomphosphaeria aponina SAG 52.96 = DSM 107014 TaxID=1521640 RepID=A0A941GUA9_9CHRO|nr:glycosyltransferase [Gomphosphaeria aponina SAG 52.96 = DSM 107014]
MGFPRVSVVIPTYNCDRYIAQAVESVLNQKNFDDYEIIVIDDGSQDNTEAVLKPYEGKNFRYVLQNNQGVALARNHGIELAEGELIAFLDADDYFLRAKLAAQVAIFEEQPNLGIVHSGWRRVDPDGKLLMNVRPWKNVPELTLESWLRWKPILPSAMMFRRHWLKLVGGFDPRYPPAEDTELVLRLALAGCEAAWLQRVTVCYRQHGQSAMSKGLPQARSLAAAMRNFFAQPNLPEGVQLIERQVLYGTFVWIAWYLYSTGHPTEMVKYLRESLSYRSASPLETIINWGDSFAEYCTSLGEELDADALGKLPEWQDLVKSLLWEQEVSAVKLIR